MDAENRNIVAEQEEKLTISTDGSFYLTTTAKWATFLAILGFIGTGLLVLGGLSVLVISPLSPLSSTIGFPITIIGVLYILFAALYFMPSYYLFNFASKTKEAISRNSQEELDESLKNLKNTFKFLGIMAIVVISAYIIMIPAVLFFSLSKVM